MYARDLRLSVQRYKQRSKAATRFLQGVDAVLIVNAPVWAMMWNWIVVRVSMWNSIISLHFIYYRNVSL